jgi:formiminotetrahydrofolate cyclodeaminase
MNEYSISSLPGLSCTEFSEQLSSKAPVPGGGGAAALIGSLAAALGMMATNLTLGKKKFLPYEEDHKRIICESDILRTCFLRLIEEDAAAFEPLSRAYSMDKNSPDYAATMRKAILDAVDAPFRMMKSCCKLIVLLEELLGKCSALLLSDVGCAAVAARAALEAASLNVFVNTRLLTGDADAEHLSLEADSMLEQFIPRAQALSDSVMEHLRK